MIYVSPEEAGFLRAVRAAPDDDLPRTVYADWLDENGRPLRAEFIRLQIDLALQERSGEYNGGRFRQTKRLEELFREPEARGPTLLGGLDGLLVRADGGSCEAVATYRENQAGQYAGVLTWTEPAAEHVWRLTWRRGFVTAAGAPYEEWVKFGDLMTGFGPEDTVHGHPLGRVDFGDRPPRNRCVNVNYARGAEPSERTYCLADLGRRPRVRVTRTGPWPTAEAGADDAITQELLRGEWPSVRDWTWDEPTFRSRGASGRRYTGRQS